MNKYKVKPKININIFKKKDIPISVLDKLMKGETHTYKQIIIDNNGKRELQPLLLETFDLNNIKVRLLDAEPWRVLIHGTISDNDRTLDRPISYKFFSDKLVDVNGTPKEFIGTDAELKNEIIKSINNYTRTIAVLNTSKYGDNDYGLFEFVKPPVFVDNNDFKHQINLTANLDINKKLFDVEYEIEKRRKHTELTQIYNENILSINNPANKNCVIYYFEILHKNNPKRKIYRELVEQFKKFYKDNKIITPENLKDILMNNDVSFYLYAVNGVCVGKKMCEKFTKTDKQPYIRLYYEDNHLYEIKDRKHDDNLTKKVIIPKEYNKLPYKFIEDKEMSNEFLLETPLLSFKTSKSGEQGLLFKASEKLLTNNKKLNVIDSLINKLNIDKKIILNDEMSFISKIINEKQIKISHSIFPFNIAMYNNALLYTNKNITVDERDKTLLKIDKNKCHSCALYELEFIPYFNILTNMKREYIQDEKIIDTNMYFINIDEPNEIYYNNGFWFGWFLNKYGYENIKIKYVFECDTMTEKKELDETEQLEAELDGNYPKQIYINPYKSLIKELYDICETDEQRSFMKESINIYIGQMINPEMDKFKYNKDAKITTINDVIQMNKMKIDEKIMEQRKYNIDDDSINKTYDNFTFDEQINALALIDSSFKFESINDKMFLIYNEETHKNDNMGRDNRPLNIMIKNKAQSYIIDLIQKYNIDSNDIIEINTDAIYMTNSNKYKFDIIDDSKNFIGWKFEKQYKKPQDFNYNLYPTELTEDKYFYSTNGNKYYFNLQYAGGGKTTNIKNIIDKELKKNKNYEYVIISPYNDFLIEYRKNGYKAHTIAHYKLHNIEIKEKNIFVDEYGICGVEDNLYLFRHKNKNIYFYGDMNQLQPVQSNNLNNDFIKKIY